MSKARKSELVLESVATAVVATAIVETGLSIGKIMVRQPVILFGLGIAAGYFTHKHRKEIIALSSHTAEKGKHLILQQKDQLSELLAEIHGGNEQKDSGD